MATVRIAFERESALILFYGGLIYVGFYAVNTAMPSQFTAIYGFNDLQNGLAFIPLSGGSIISAFTNGRLLDANYRRHARRLGFPVDKRRQIDLSDFPIERARIEIALPLLYACAGCMVAYGWILHFETHLAGPLIMLFLLGYTVIAGFKNYSFRY